MSNHTRRPEILTTIRPHCAVCGGPIYEDVEPLLPGSLVLHAACNRITHDRAVRRLRAEGQLLHVGPPCDVCGEVFDQGQRTPDAQICGDCLAPRSYGKMRHAH